MDTPQRVALRMQFANAVEAAPARPRRTTEWDASAVRSAAQRLESLSGFAEGEAANAAANMRALALRLHTVADLVEPNQRTPGETALARTAVDNAVARSRAALLTMAEGARRDLRSALPEAVRAQMVSPGGRYLVMAHPTGDMWETEPLERFVTALRAEDPHATGAPMTVSESMKSMERSFLQQAILATLMVTILLWVDLRNVRETLAALGSLAIGVAWTVGLMAAFGTSFNLANFFAIPIMIGLGIDSAIHITHRAHEGALDHGFGSTRRAVIVTAMTTTIGFGALILAHHQGLRSLGIAMAVGSGCCLVTAVWTLPALLRVIGLRPKNGGLRLVSTQDDAQQRGAA
jgi:predicted RND superfamily exporter protein